MAKQVRKALDETKRYRDKRTGAWYTYPEMLEVWRTKYEGIARESGLPAYNWHARFDYFPPETQKN